MHCMQGTENADFSPFHSQDLNTYGDGSENLALDQLIITLLTFFSILITCLLDIEVIM